MRNEIKKILGYIDGILSEEENKEVELLISSNPGYLELVWKLLKMKQQFESDQIIEIMEKEKERMRDRLFNNTSKPIKVLRFKPK